MSRTVFVYHDDYLKYDFGGSHILRQERLILARKLMQIYGLVGSEGAEELTPEPATDEDILMVHEKEYVDVLKHLSDNPEGFSLEHGLGITDNPVFKGMYDASIMQVGGTLLSCKSVVGGTTDRAFNIGGGFHHALPNRASGFCLLNDVAIGIKQLLEKYGIKRILYVDIDVHHGDGVQFVFLKDPRVMTISIHEDGRYLFPGTGFEHDVGEGEGTGYAVNIPLPPYTGNASYLHAFNEIVAPLADAFKPEIIITQLGVDAHRSDPLAHLNLTTHVYEEIATIYDDISQRHCNNRWVAVTGGGYDMLSCSRIWTLILSKMIGRQVSDNLPTDWVDYCKNKYAIVPKGGVLKDVVKEKDLISSEVMKVIQLVKNNVFKYHKID